MTKVRANDIAIEYDSFGPNDAETMLLISGLGVQMIRWAVPFCEALAARGYRVIRFDNRDAGLSTHLDGAPVPELMVVARAVARGARPNVPYSLHDMADDAAGLLDALDIERAHVIGRSMGGMIAQLMASEHPDRVLSLTSIMSSTGNPGLPPAASEAVAALTRRAPDPSGDEEGFLAHAIGLARVIASPGYPFDETAQRAQALAELRRASNPAGFGRQIAAIAATGDRRARLNTITVPTLVVHGAADKLVPAAAGRDTAENIPGAELKVIDGMGHDLPPELYETVISAIVANARRACRRP
ncbi:MAG: alpha/beta fold hydrolase [Phreatobacter sp.]